MHMKIRRWPVVPQLAILNKSQRAHACREDTRYAIVFVSGILHVGVEGARIGRGLRIWRINQHEVVAWVRNTGGRCWVHSNFARGIRILYRLVGSSLDEARRRCALECQRRSLGV